MNNKDIINRLIGRGWIVFNPFTMSIAEPRYVVHVGETQTYEIQDTDISELIVDLIIQAETENSHIDITRNPKNAFIEIYAFDTFAEVDFLLGFKTLSALKQYKVKNKLETIIYFDNETQETIEL
jgi:hypothetical protein